MELLALPPDSAQAALSLAAGRLNGRACVAGSIWASFSEVSTAIRWPSTGVFGRSPFLKRLQPLEARAAAINSAIRIFLDLLILVLLGLRSEGSAGVGAEASGDLDRTVSKRGGNALVLGDGREQLPSLLLLALLDKSEPGHFAPAAEPGVSGLRQRLHAGDDLRRLQLVEFERSLADKSRVAIGIRERAIVGDLFQRRYRKLLVVLLEREGGAGEEGGRTDGLARTLRKIVELLGHFRGVTGADVLVDLRHLLDMRFGGVLAVLLEPDHSPRSGKEQDQQANEVAAVVLEEVAETVAPQVLVDLAHESFRNVRGLRQRRSFSPLAWESFCRPLPFPTLDERKLAAARLAAVAQNAKPLTFRPVRLVHCREGSRAHFFGVGAGRFTNPAREIIVALHESWSSLEHAEHVIDHQHLAVAIGRRPDADHRGSNGFGDFGRDRLHHPLDDDAERACVGDRLRVGDDLLGLMVLAAAGAVATQHVHCLGSEADMADDGHPALGEKADRRGHGLAPLELDRGAAGLLHDPRRGFKCSLWRRFVAAERHVHRDEGMPAAPNHRGAVRTHHFEGHWNRR